MNKTIMIVEDEKDFHEIYAMMLEGRDYKLIYAYDGEEAKPMLEDKKPDLIIMDTIMGMVTGDTFLLHLKGHDDLADIPVIIISSSNPQKQLIGLKKIDPNLLYLNKADLTKERLLEVVEKKLVA